MAQRLDLGRAENHQGARFGRWSVLEFSHRDGKHAWWTCQCECGALKVIAATSLKSGETSRCKQCWELERPEFIRKRSTRHGHSKGYETPEYRIWTGMKARCINPRASYYHLYGGRGIRVCERWIDSFENFFKDMGRKPSPEHSIDRIDTNGNYEPANCRWATAYEQSRNMRKNRHVTVFGERLIISDACRKYNVAHSTIWSYVQVHSMTYEQAFRRAAGIPDGSR